jgi:CRP/FNR family cyclic AMP-dependent transcriptional regulator
MSWIDSLGYIASAFALAAVYMNRMIPLRIAGIISGVFSVAFGFFGEVYPTLILNAILLPLNSVRLYQMLQLIKNVKEAAGTDLSMDWLRPFMSARQYRAGDILFRKGDAAGEMLYTVSGQYRLTELETVIGRGNVIGELGIISAQNRRTQTVECIENGQVLTIGYDDVRQLYFQNPRFGFYLLRLIGERLSRDIARLESSRP